jgi:hypothetical protein
MLIRKCRGGPQIFKSVGLLMVSSGSKRASIYICSGGPGCDTAVVLSLCERISSRGARILHSNGPTTPSIARRVLHFARFRGGPTFGVQNPGVLHLGMRFHTAFVERSRVWGVQNPGGFDFLENSYVLVRAKKAGVCVGGDASRTSPAGAKLPSPLREGAGHCASFAGAGGRADRSIGLHGSPGWEIKFSKNDGARRPRRITRPS